MAAEKLPALQFYTGDWRKDPAVQSLDLEHKGAWIELLCIMNETSERGRLVLPNGAPIPDSGIAKNLGLDEAKWKQIRSTLVALGVASEDESGVLFNRRIVRDEATRRAKADAGRKGGSAPKRKAGAKQPPSKPEANGGSSARARAPASSSSSVSASANYPPPPPARGTAERISELVRWLGQEHREVALACAETANDPGSWALGLTGLYGPGGTDPRVFGSLAEPKRPAAVATAMLRFVGQGQPWDGKFFRGILARVVAEESQPPGPTRIGAGPAQKPRGPGINELFGKAAS